MDNIEQTRTWGQKWATAMVKAQSKFARIGKSKTVTVSAQGRGSYSYDYTPLDQLVEETAPVLAECELAVIQDNWMNDARVFVQTTVLHASGEFREYEALSYPMPNGRIHDLGSILSYLRRYSYLSALRLAPSDMSDDDGKRIMEMRNDPRPDASAITPEQVEPYINRVADIMAADIDEDELNESIFRVHQELATKPELYTAVADALASKKVIGKAAWKQAITDYRTRGKAA